jgi:hypothetical protein
MVRANFAKFLSQILYTKYSRTKNGYSENLTTHKVCTGGSTQVQKM